jgi:putative ABC transport system ATP-binding protein
MKAAEVIQMANTTAVTSSTKPEGAKALLALEGLTKVFQTEEVETHALMDVHLAVDPGEWLAIVGPSGSGKTTLLALLGLLDTPSSGRDLLDGRPVESLSAAERAVVRNRHIGFIFQSFNLIGDLTVFENVELPLTYRGMPANERKERVEKALERQQQRVAVARAVAGEPLLLLADEPTGNLDSKNGGAVMELLAELHQGGATLCMVTHDPAQARLAKREVHLFDGRIVQDERR